MDWLIWLGAFVSVLGLAGLIYCIVRVWRAKSAGMDDAALNTVLKSVMPLNTGALMLSVIGLMMVVLGVMLG